MLLGGTGRNRPEPGIGLPYLQAIAIDALFSLAF